MSLLLLILIVFLLFGGGYYGYRRQYDGAGGDAGSSRLRPFKEKNGRSCSVGKRA